MASGIFSTYRQGENRVTSTFLSVLQRLSVDKIERIIGALLEDDRFQLIRFDNQVHLKEAVPDARIQANFAIWIETKTSRDSLGRDQVDRHLKAIDPTERLLLLTPDWDQPASVPDIEQVRWANFRSLAQALRSLLNDAEDPTTEREAFLIREFLIVLETDGLLEEPQDLVLVIAANRALPEYQRLGAYICQPKRSFRKASHLAFYASGCIAHVVPQILGTIEEVTLTADGAETIPDVENRARLKALITQLEKAAPQRIGEVNKVIFLSNRDDPETKKLKFDVRNDRRTAFTQGHRYVSLDSLLANPETISALIREQ